MILTMILLLVMSMSVNFSSQLLFSAVAVFMFG